MGGLDAVKLLQSEPVVFFLFDGTPCLPDWHYWRELKPGENLAPPISTHTCSPTHYKDCTHTHSFIPGYVSSLGCQSNIHNLLLDFQQQPLSLPACLFPFIFTIFWEKESQYEFCQYCTAASLSFSFSLLLR